MDTITAPGLKAELRAVEHDWPGWHLYTSDSGRIWAATKQNHSGGSGTTLDAATPQEMRHEIAVQVREWERVAA